MRASTFHGKHFDANNTQEKHLLLLSMCMPTSTPHATLRGISTIFHNAASKSSQDFWHATYWVNWGNGGIILEKDVNKAHKKHEEFHLYKVCFLNIWYTTIISMHTLIFNMNARKVRVALTALRAIASQHYDRIMTFQRENEHFHVRYSHSDDIQRHAQLYFLIILSQR